VKYEAIDWTDLTMGIWNWIWIAGLVVLGSGVFAVVFRIFVASYVDDLAHRKLAESHPGYWLDDFRKMVLGVEEMQTRRGFSINRSMEEHYRAIEAMRELGVELTGTLKNHLEGLSAEADERRRALLERLDERRRDDAYMQDREEQLTSALRNHLEGLSAQADEKSRLFLRELDERRRDDAQFKNRVEESIHFLADQREQLERLSAELAASKVKQHQLEEAMAVVISQREPEETRRRDRVWFAAFAPRTVAPGATFLLDIWAHTLEQSGVVAAIAKELTRSQKIGVKAGIDVRRGTIVALEISIPTFNATGVDCMVWAGEPVNASFPVLVPENAHPGSHSGSAAISVAGLRIAELWFSLTVGAEASENPGELPIGIRQFRSAFASYATSERAEVLARLQGIKKVAPDMQVFLDVLSLRSGDHWQEALAREVPTKDVFYLFWSQAAAASEWVAREWSLALTKRGLTYIDPVPLQDPRHAPPPDELSDLHFNDAYLAYIKLENQLSET
jgi:hypothetical protein